MVNTFWAIGLLGECYLKHFNKLSGTCQKPFVLSSSLLDIIATEAKYNPCIYYVQ